MKLFDVENLKTEAMRRTGFSDFGQPDCLENLESLVLSINTTGEISQDRWDATYEYLIRILVNRLWFAKDLGENPEILEEILLPPAAIVALPRTGSTKLQRMLGVSDQFQNLLWWHMHMFARIPGKPDGGNAQRLQETREFEHWVYDVCPDMVKGHPRFAEEPEEEQILNEFMFSPTMAVQFSGADYSQDRLMKADPQPMFDYMAMQLKYLQWQFYPETKRPWLLKSPTNLGFEENMITTFGRDMKIICSHRDPVNVVCSIAKTSEYYRQVFSTVESQEKTHRLGLNMLNALAYVMQKHMQWRDDNPDVHVLDLSFKEINTDSVGVLHKVYAFMGLDVTPEKEQAILAWDLEQQGKHQRNDYSLDYFGLTEEQVRTAFKPYLERYAGYL